MSTPYGKARLAATILYDITSYAVRSFFYKNWKYTLRKSFLTRVLLLICPANGDYFLSDNVSLFGLRIALDVNCIVPHIFHT